MRLKEMKVKTPFAVPFAFFLLTASVIGLINLNSGSLIPIGERAAVFSAALIMPDGGFLLLEERFASELYPPDEESGGAFESRPFPYGEAELPKGAPLLSDEDYGIALNGGASARLPRIPEKYRASIISEDFSGHNGSNLIRFGAGFIKNDTKNEDSDVAEILETGFALRFEDIMEPQVLIIHTHATESFERFDSDVYDTRNKWRSTDNNLNIVAVGSAIQETLENNGIGVLHDTTQHDYPSYNGSYERSAETIRRHLEEYPSIKVVLDLHRDAMERDEQVLVKPIAEIGGKKAAQVMIVSGCDNGSMDMPNWRENLRFAAALGDKALSMHPGLMRPVYLCHRKYNMDLTTGSLLLEFGSNANTLDEAVYSARLVAEALSELIWENIKEA
ncbi:MAG: stage II sporulation protein P [Oscillospiraceae bacterium]|nr:stage II sporulation protein P [Oscillospiraceae bacterium]